MKTSNSILWLVVLITGAIGAPAQQPRARDAELVKDVDIDVAREIWDKRDAAQLVKDVDIDAANPDSDVWLKRDAILVKDVDIDVASTNDLDWLKRESARAI